MIEVAAVAAVAVAAAEPRRELDTMGARQLALEHSIENGVEHMTGVPRGRGDEAAARARARRASIA